MTKLELAKLEIQARDHILHQVRFIFLGQEVINEYLSQLKVLCLINLYLKGGLISDLPILLHWCLYGVIV